MNKELVEQTVLETIRYLNIRLDDSSQHDLLDFAIEYQKRIDADRGKEAVGEMQMSSLFKDLVIPVIFEHSEVFLGDKLFLSPTIPEGMALVPTVITPPIRDVIEDMQGCRSYQDFYDDLLAAAQGERNAG